jgi:hypothetical protein
VVEESGPDKTKDGSVEAIHNVTINLTFFVNTVLVFGTLILNTISMFEKIIYLAVLVREKLKTVQGNKRWNTSKLST